MPVVVRIAELPQGHAGRLGGTDRRLRRRLEKRHRCRADRVRAVVTDRRTGSHARVRQFTTVVLETGRKRRDAGSGQFTGTVTVEGVDTHHVLWLRP